MTPRAGFFKAFFGSCCGRNIFYTLRHHSWKRTLFHLFLLSMITGFFIGNARSQRFSTLVDAAEAAFTSVFGDKIWVSTPQNSWNWVAPVKDPLKPREMALPGGGRLYYTGSSKTLPASLKSVTGITVVWSPEALGIAVPGANGGDCVIIERASARIDRFTGTNAALEKIFKKAPGKLPAEKMTEENANTFFMVIQFLYTVTAVCGTVLWNFFITLLYTGIFVGMYRLLNGPSGRLRFLTLKEMWKCGIYAAFPAMAVATFFPVLELPFISYETVFMIGLLIYWLSVTAKLESTPAPDEVNNADKQ